jgi:hypothetical protein
MRAPLCWIFGLCATVIWCAAGRAQEATATRPASGDENWGQVTVPELRVRFRKPTDWQIVLGPVRQDGRAPGVRGFHIRIPKGADDTASIVGLHRTPATLPAGEDGARRVQEMLEYRRDAVAKGRLAPVEDVEIRVAGCPGWIFTTDYEKGHSVMRVMSIFFVSDEAEFRAVLSGQVDSVKAERPKVIRLLESMEFVSKQPKQ